MKHKIGEIVRVINPYSGGDFDDGDIVRISCIGCEEDKSCYGAVSPHDGYLWYLQEDEVEPVTNAGRIRAMSDEELEDFLIRIEGEQPWSKQFSEKFCNNCPTTTCTVEGCSNPIELFECDFTDGKCPHGSDIFWWIQQPV